jgi:hypothetical protein
MVAPACLYYSSENDELSPAPFSTFTALNPALRSL